MLGLVGICILLLVVDNWPTFNDVSKSFQVQPSYFEQPVMPLESVVVIGDEKIGLNVSEDSVLATFTVSVDDESSFLLKERVVN